MPLLGLLTARGDAGRAGIRGEAGLGGRFDDVGALDAAAAAAADGRGGTLSSSRIFACGSNGGTPCMLMHESVDALFACRGAPPRSAATTSTASLKTI